MIVVAEGPSAAGKTTWTATWPAHVVVAETGRVAPPLDASEAELARFWLACDERRWAEAIAIEGEHGTAVCDTDPLKLHYTYCLARLGPASWDAFDLAADLRLASVRERRLGIADRIACSIPSDDLLDAQRRADATRTRRNFALHSRFGPALRDWYGTLARLDPARVAWNFPDDLETVAVTERYDDVLFTEWMRALPRDPIDQPLTARCGSFQLGRGKWQV